MDIRRIKEIEMMADVRKFYIVDWRDGITEINGEQRNVTAWVTDTFFTREEKKQILECPSVLAIKTTKRKFYTTEKVHIIITEI